jgi:Leucine-rich repeat (LRR) protein
MALQTLDIGMNGIVNEGAVALSASLSHLTALQTLNISCNGISAEGAVARSASLSHLTALQTLDISGNGIVDEGAVALSASLTFLTALQTLGISNNPFGGALGVITLLTSICECVEFIAISKCRKDILISIFQDGLN